MKTLWMKLRIWWWWVRFEFAFFCFLFFGKERPLSLGEKQAREVIEELGVRFGSGEVVEGMTLFLKEGEPLIQTLWPSSEGCFADRAAAMVTDYGIVNVELVDANDSFEGPWFLEGVGAQEAKKHAK